MQLLWIEVYIEIPEKYSQLIFWSSFSSILYPIILFGIGELWALGSQSVWYNQPCPLPLRGVGEIQLVRKGKGARAGIRTKWGRKIFQALGMQDKRASVKSLRTTDVSELLPILASGKQVNETGWSTYIRKTTCKTLRVFFFFSYFPFFHSLIFFVLPITDFLSFPSLPHFYLDVPRVFFFSLSVEGVKIR